ncbi:hypothetical protein D9M69_490650 [compost metagenome]
MAGDVVHACAAPVLDATDDDSAEVADIQWLAHIASVPRDREDRDFLHETREPAEVLAVEPAEHQRWAQHGAGDPAGQHHVFLGLLAACVEVIGHGFNDR